MAQFDVHKYRPRGANFRYVVDVQHDHLASVKTRVVVPAYPMGRLAGAAERINPVVMIENWQYALVVQELASLRSEFLGEPVASVAAGRDDIIAALDLLFTGI